jgi:phospholipid/cholesterol/gamma-HCH transport system substrate-binding protein
METRANYALIGLFTIAVVAAAFGFVYWFSGSDSGARRQPVRIVFSGSVAGLSKGSVVLFNGIRVGEVTDLRLLADDPRRVVAQAEIDRTTPIRTDTRARLEVNMLSGVAQIALIGGEPGAPPLQPTPGQTVATIYADRSDFQDILEMARSLARRADDIMEGVSRLVAENQGPIARTIQNAERFSQALSDNAPGINRFLAQVGQAAERVGPLAEKLETLATDLSELVRSVDRQRIARILENAESFAQSLGDNKQNIANILQDTATLARRLNDAAPKLDATLTDVGNVARAIDPVKLHQAIDGAERFATALGNSSNDVQKAISEAAEITGKLNRAADRIDGVLAAAEGFLGSASGEEGKGTFVAIRDAADSIRLLADNLDRRTAEITAGINRFTGSGARELEAAATDARRAINDVSRAVRSLERNPNQLIFGGRPSLPEYSGRR